MAPCNSKESNASLLERLSCNIYITNFLALFSAKELWNTCLKYVLDVFIPNKVSKQGKHFAFARFNKKSYSNVPLNSSKPSFAKVVKNNEIPKNHEEPVVLEDVVLNFEGNPILVGSVKDFKTLSNLYNVIYSEGFSGFKITYLGSFWVLLEFDTFQSCENFRTNEAINSWFSSLNYWTSDFEVHDRVVWIDVEGVPLKVWSKYSFNKIATTWREFIFMDDSNSSNKYSMRLCVKITLQHLIAESFKVILKCKVYVVRAKEPKNYGTLARSISRMCLSWMKFQSKNNEIPKNHEEPVMVLEDAVLNFEGNPILVGSVKDFKTLYNLHNVIYSEGFSGFKITYLGSFWVLLEFDTFQSRENFRTNEAINFWFSNLNYWTSDFEVHDRVFWIYVEGVPLKAWSKSSFNKIATKWGEFNFMDDSNSSNKYSMRLCVTGWAPEFGEDTSNQSEDFSDNNSVGTKNWVESEDDDTHENIQKTPKDEDDVVPDSFQNQDFKDSSVEWNINVPNNRVNSENHSVENTQKTPKDLSGDPFGLEDLIFKSSKKDTKEAQKTNDSNPKFPSGFTP
nr:nucleotide-binding alpha-beta plait domain-containing protein [Tanacetum cinerariifolium]